jgi:mono/diheme cytochrome c family protein
MGNVKAVVARSGSRMIGGALLGGLIVVGCAATQLGATQADLARAQSQAKQGAAVFANQCAKCHGQRGEGIGNTPDVMGPGALPEYPRNTVSASDPAASDPQLLQIEAQARPAGAFWRDPFHNAQDLFTFVSTRMPKANPGKLSQPDYWAVVTFLLSAQGASLPATGLGPAAAKDIPIPRR